MLGDYGMSELDRIAPSEEYYEEARYCIKHHKSLLDFDCWTHIEESVGQHIPYEDYATIDSMVDDDLLDYNAEEIRELYQTHYGGGQT